MPPKSRITRQMILDSSIEVVRTKGIQNLNVRAIATDLKCSTQPIMYHFATMEDLKSEIYGMVAQQHFVELMNAELTQSEDPCADLSRKYIRYAVEKPNLFRFLYQSDRFTMERLEGSWDRSELCKLLEVIAQRYDINPAKARKIFVACLLSAHGFASFLANNTIPYSEEDVDNYIQVIRKGSLSVIKEL